jgi:molybdopterin converting factor small subunit
MLIQLKLFGGLQKHLPGEEVPYAAEVPHDATIADVLRTFRIAEEKPRILLVNGRHARLEHVLQENDVLAVFPPVAGG